MIPPYASEEEQGKDGRSPSGPGCQPSASAPSGSSQSGIPNAWPLCGYAPGQYMGKCRDCGVQWMDQDKRSYQCLECAARTANTAMARGAEALKALRLFREFTIRNATQWLTGAGDHGHPVWLMLAELLPSDDIRNGPEWRFIQPENRASLADLVSGDRP